MKYTEIYEARYGNQGTTVFKSLSPSERAAWDIVGDLSDRRGFDCEWDNIDDEIKDEIFKTWVSLINAAVK